MADSQVLDSSSVIESVLSFGVLMHGPMILMVVVGLLGGWLSWLNADYEHEFCRRRLIRNLITGVLATLMVPLFLQMIGSNLLAEISPNYQQFYVFLGMCSAAAFISQRFASTVSEQLLQRANDRAEHAEITAKTASERTISIETEQIKLQGSMHMIKKEFEEALVFMEEYLKHNPEDSNTLWRKAYCLKRVGRTARALKDIDLAIKYSKKPQGMLYFNKACYMSILNKNINDIIISLEKALELEFESVKVAIEKDLKIDLVHISNDAKFISFLEKHNIRRKV